MVEQMVSKEIDQVDFQMAVALEAAADRNNKDNNTSHTVDML